MWCLATKHEENENTNFFNAYFYKPGQHLSALHNQLYLPVQIANSKYFSISHHKKNTTAMK